MKKFFKRDKKFYTGLAILVVSLFVVIVGTLYFYTKTDSDVLVVIGDSKITQKDVDEQVYGLYFDESMVATDEQKNEILDELIEWEIVKKEAEKRGITVTDDEILERAKKDLDNYLNYSDRQKEITDENIGNVLLKEKLQDKIISYREGRYLLLHYGRHIESDLSVTELQKNLEDEGRSERVKEEKDYATSLINGIHDDLSANKITFEQAIEKTNIDAKVGSNSFLPVEVLGSGEFSKDLWRSGDFIASYNDFRENALKTTTGKISRPFDIKILLNNGTETNGLISIVSIEKGLDGEADNYDTWLTNKISEYSVKETNLRLVSVAYADNTGVYNKSNWGVHGGGPGAAAGLVVGVYVKPLSGTTWKKAENTGLRVSKKTKIGPYDTPFYYMASTPKDVNYIDIKTNEKIYSGIQSSNDHVHDHAYAVMGYGNKLNNGDRYALSCSWTFDVKIDRSVKSVLFQEGISPSKYEASWKNRSKKSDGTWSGWSQANTRTITAINGSTREIQFLLEPKLRNNPPKVVIYGTQKNGTGSFHASGTKGYDKDATNKVKLTGNGVDPDGDQVRVGIQVKKNGVTVYQEMDGNHDGWGKTWTNLFRPTVYKASATIKNIRVGNYAWRMRAVDQNGASSSWSGWWTFTVVEDEDEDEEADLQCLKLTATPETGTVPLSVKFTVLTTSTNVTNPLKYSWDLDNDGIEDKQTSTNSYTYTYREGTGEPVTAKVIVSDSTNPPATCYATTKVTVKPWSEEDEGEVAP